MISRFRLALLVTCLGVLGAGFVNAAMGDGPNLPQKLRSIVMSKLQAKQLLGNDLGTVHENRVADFQRQMQTQGHVLIPANAHMGLNKVRNQLRPLPDFHGKLSFALKEPAWLPAGFQLVGALPGGPTGRAPWKVVILYYGDGQNEIKIEEADMTEGTVVLADEFLTAKINGIPATYLTTRVEGTNVDWHVFHWVDGNMSYVVEGNLPKADVEKVAQSLNAR